MNRELMVDRVGEITWYAYTVEEGEIKWHEFEADGLGEAKKVCQEKGWILDDDYWLPEVIRW